MTLAPKEGTDGHFVSNKNWFDAWKNPWISQQDKDLVKRCNITGKIYADKIPGFFRDFHSLIEILNINNLNTVSVTDMSSLFCGCHALKSLDLSNFDTSKVTDMSSMFSNCDCVTLDVSNFDTSNVTDMSWMFNSCDKLAILDVSHFNTSKVRDMSFMFNNCDSLTYLDLSNFDTQTILMKAKEYILKGKDGGSFVRQSSFFYSYVPANIIIKIKYNYFR